MKKFLAISLLSCLVVPAIGYASGLGSKVSATLEPSLVTALDSASADTIFDVLVAATDSRQLAHSVELVSKGLASLALRHQQIAFTRPKHPSSMLSPFRRIRARRCSTSFGSQT
ncbi:MAG: hypothetical protein HZB43_10815 [candidate division Zixibacteria bacterium]|nr:hypothetical protein [candidate division Zixibacteria bacterium]